MIYAWLAKIGGKILGIVALVLALAATVAYAKVQRTGRIHAEAVAARVTTEKDALTANAKRVVWIMVRHAERERERAREVDVLKGRIRNAKRPLPQECVAALAPLRVALDGVRRNYLANRGTGPADADVLGGTAAPGGGD